jgi:hypothetical protein
VHNQTNDVDPDPDPDQVGSASFCRIRIGITSKANEKVMNLTFFQINFNIVLKILNIMANLNLHFTDIKTMPIHNTASNTKFK